MAMTGDEAVRNFDTTFQHEYKVRVRFLLRLKELCQQDRANLGYVSDLRQRIESSLGTLLPAKQRSADGALGELVLLLPEEEQLAYASDFVLHTRRSRRVTGYKIIRRHPAHGLKQALVDCYRSYGDREALLALLANGEDICDVSENLEATIESLGARYYQALALEHVLARDEQLAFSFATKFPMAFIWAGARQRNKAVIPMVVQRLQSRLQEVESATTIDRGSIAAAIEIPILVWAVGRVGARDYLADLTNKYEITLPWLSSARN